MPTPQQNLSKPATAASSVDDREGVSIVEAARIAGVSRSKLYELLRDGTVKSRNIGRRRVVIRRSLAELFR